MAVECWAWGVDDDRVGGQRCCGSKSDWHALCLQHKTKKVSHYVDVICSECNYALRLSHVTLDQFGGKENKEESRQKIGAGRQ